MAINPNTDFSAGAVLTAAQQNRFPRGIMALSNLTANTSIPNAETTRTSVSFTAIANRYYRITWYEGLCTNANASVNNFYLRLDTTGGTIIGTANLYMVAGDNKPNILSVVTTFSAGTRTIYARATENAATSTTLTASSTQPAFLLVEDIGPA